MCAEDHTVLIIQPDLDGQRVFLPFEALLDRSPTQTLSNRVSHRQTQALTPTGLKTRTTQRTDFTFDTGPRVRRVRGVNLPKSNNNNCH